METTSKNGGLMSLDCPYTEDKRFDWYRGFHVGGKSLMWGDKVTVLVIIILKIMLKMDKMTGLFVIKMLQKWYDYVEKFAGISGQAENGRCYLMENFTTNGSKLC
jgi:hypothetical protein